MWIFIPSPPLCFPWFDTYALCLLPQQMGGYRWNILLGGVQCRVNILFQSFSCFSQLMVALLVPNLSVVHTACFAPACSIVVVFHKYFNTVQTFSHCPILFFLLFLNYHTVLNCFHTVQTIFSPSQLFSHCPVYFILVTNMFSLSRIFCHEYFITVPNFANYPTTVFFPAILLQSELLIQFSHQFWLIQLTVTYVGAELLNVNSSLGWRLILWMCVTCQLNIQSSSHSMPVLRNACVNGLPLISSLTLHCL